MISDYEMHKSQQDTQALKIEKEKQILKSAEKMEKLAKSVEGPESTKLIELYALLSYMHSTKDVQRSLDLQAQATQITLCNFGSESPQYISRLY